MNDCKKISVVGRYNEEKKKYEVDRVVFFMNNSSPVIQNYSKNKHSKYLMDCVEKNMPPISIIDFNNRNDMEKLEKEIEEEKAKHTNFKYKSILNLSIEDSELADYFSLEIKRDKKIATKEELERIDTYTKFNRRIATLEEGRKVVLNGELSSKKFEKLHDAYRKELAIAIKKARVITDEEYKGLEEYFEFEKARDNGNIKPLDQIRISHLARSNKFVAELENARALLLSNDSESLKNSKDSDFVLNEKNYQDYKDEGTLNFEHLHSFYEKLLKRAKTFDNNKTTSEKEKVKNLKNSDATKLEPTKEVSANLSEVGLMPLPKKEKSLVKKESNSSKSSNDEDVDYASFTGYFDALDEDKPSEVVKEASENKNVIILPERLDEVKEEKEALIENASVKESNENKNVIILPERLDEVKEEKETLTENAGVEKSNENKNVIILPERLDEVKKEKETLTENASVKESNENKNVIILPERLDEVKETKEENERKVNINNRRNLNKEIITELEDDEKPLFEIVKEEMLEEEKKEEREMENQKHRRRTRNYNSDAYSNLLNTEVLNEEKTPRRRKRVYLDKENKDEKVVVGEIKDDADYVENINVEGKPVKVRAKRRLNLVVAAVLGFVTPFIARLIPDSLKQKINNFISNANRENKVEHVQNASMNGLFDNGETIPTPGSSIIPNQTVAPNFTNVPEQTNVYENATTKQGIAKETLLSIIQNYFEKMNVKEETRKFIMSETVQQFLSQYKNREQIEEVLSALCYGYEANILCKKDGNFRIEQDGDNYLRAFTKDFLCAKVVVNNYTPVQMRAVFGDTQVTYEQVMDGFRGFYDTVVTYGTTATEKLPFKYLTNGENESTKMLDRLFEKLIVVNQNRKNGTLTREHTDAFIVELDKIYVQNEGSVNLNSTVKTLGNALAYSFMMMQSNVFGGEALVLSKDYGLAIKGLNLVAIEDGSLALRDKNGKLNIIDNVMNFRVSDEASYEECTTEQKILLNNINEMNLLVTRSKEDILRDFENLLYRNDLAYYANRVANGDYSSELLAEIESKNPALASIIDQFEKNIKNAESEYVPFNVTVDEIDKILGIKGYTNDYATLINIRRDLLQRTNKKHRDIPSTSSTTITTETKTEKVKYDDLTAEEKAEVDKQVREMTREEERKNSEQIEKATKVAQEIVTGIQEQGMTQEEATKKAEEVGMVLEEDLYQNLKDMYEGKEVTEAFDKEIERKNAEEIQRSNERAEQERKDEEARRREEEALIEQSTKTTDTQNSSQNTPETKEETHEVHVVDEEGQDDHIIIFDEDQIDPNRVDTEAGEEVYIEKEEVKEGEVTESVPVNSDETENIPESVPVNSEESENIPESTPVDNEKVEESTVESVQTEESVTVSESSNNEVDLSGQDVYEITFDDNGDTHVEVLSNSNEEVLETSNVTQEVASESVKEETFVESVMESTPVENSAQEPVHEEPAQAPASEPVHEEPAPAPAPEPVHEEPAPAPAPEPVHEEPAPAPAPEPVHEEPAPAPAPEPVHEEPAPAPAPEPVHEEPAPAPAPETPSVDESVFDMIDPNRTEEGEEIITDEVAALRDIRDALISLDGLGLDFTNVNNGKTKTLKRNA